MIDYVTSISDYCKLNHPALETICCLMPRDQSLWATMAEVDSLDNLGTDVYWVNEDRDVGDMSPLIRDMGAICRAHAKTHHEWLQCWGVRKGREGRIREHGEVLVAERPDALYVWAWEGQVGTAESCDDPARAWSQAREVLRMAQGG